MANTPQSKKRARQNERKLEVNKARRSRIRTFQKKVEEAITSGDKSAANTALKSAQPELMRGVTKGVYKKNTAARKIHAVDNQHQIQICQSRGNTPTTHKSQRQYTHNS